MKQLSKTQSLRLCIFLTGISGIVAEYVMANMASYFVGDATTQWTMIISTMLFAMGVGSHVSKFIRGNLALKFVYLELLLSLAVSLSAIVAYILASKTELIGMIIYFQSAFIGFLIGAEIPIAVRINARKDEYGKNLSSILSRDYFGALVGGLLFAFVLLPHLGLIYTPLVLASVNCFAAYIMWWSFQEELPRSNLLRSCLIGVALTLAGLFWLSKPITIYAEQSHYRDKIIFSKQTRFQKIVLTEWKNDHWLYLNGAEQFSSFDEHLYHEPLVHPALSLARKPKDVLIIGGGDGLALREVLKYSNIRSINLIDLDPEMVQIAKNHPIIKRLNHSSLTHTKVKIHYGDGFHFLKKTSKKFGAIIIDLPDPKTASIAKLYSLEFYKIVKSKLAANGSFITQASSPFFAKKAFLCILKTIRKAGFTAVPLHNQIPTMGQWGFILGSVDPELTSESLRIKLENITFRGINTRFMDRSAMRHMVQYGKDFLESYQTIRVSTLANPQIHTYYNSGRWDIY